MWLYLFRSSFALFVSFHGSSSLSLRALCRYRMAMDQLGSLSREQRFKIMRNIGNSFIKLGQYQDAIHSFEAIADQSPDAQSAFNLLVCYYALGDREKMRKVRGKRQTHTW